MIRINKIRLRRHRLSLQRRLTSADGHQFVKLASVKPDTPALWAVVNFYILTVGDDQN